VGLRKSMEENKKKGHESTPMRKISLKSYGTRTKNVEREEGGLRKGKKKRVGLGEVPISRFKKRESELIGEKRMASDAQRFCEGGAHQKDSIQK